MTCENNRSASNRHSVLKIPGEHWFQVETCSVSEGALNKSSYLIGEPAEALLLIEEQINKGLRARLRLFYSGPADDSDEISSDIVTQIFTTDTGTYFFVLKSGLSLCNPQEHRDTLVPLPGLKMAYTFIKHDE